MIKCFILALFLSPILAYTQEIPQPGEKLVQLKKPKTILNKYVNFDVAKIMIGPGFATNTFRNAPTFPFRFQFLWPVALSKRHLKIAYGITVGSSRIRAPHTELTFRNDELVSVERNDNYQYSRLRTRSVGIIAMKVIRMRNSVTILAGPSLEYNYSSYLKEKLTGKESNNVSVKNSVNDFIVPLNVQVSISSKQFLAFGFFGRFNLTPLFKGEIYKRVNQVVVGVSGSLII